jgi:hypothetical protein
MRSYILPYAKFAALALASKLTSAFADPLKPGVETTDQVAPIWSATTTPKQQSCMASDLRCASLPRSRFVTASKALSEIGFDSQKAIALKEILTMSGLIDNPDDFDQRYRGGEGLKGRRQCSASLLKFVDETQRCFSQRATSDGRMLERWETATQEWMMHQDIAHHAKVLGVVDEVKPSIRFKVGAPREAAGLPPSSVKPFYYDSKSSVLNITGPIVVVLGSTYQTMLARCQEISKVEEFLGGDPIGAIVLLGGARKAGKIDGTPEVLSQIAQEFGVSSDELTETHLIQRALKEVMLRLTKTPNVIVIDTMASGIDRPTTKTTMIEFTKWLAANPGITGAYIISKQPHVLYQGAVIAPIMETYAPWLEFEVIGPAASPSIANKALLEAISSFIWARTPEVMRQLALPISDEELPLARKLYKDNPIIEEIIRSSAELNFEKFVSGEERTLD